MSASEKSFLLRAASQFCALKMRHLRFLPQEIISSETGIEILEFVVNTLMGDDPEPPVQPFDPPTLHDLYDLEVDGPEDPNEEAVNGFLLILCC